MSCDANVALLR